MVKTSKITKCALIKEMAAAFPVTQGQASDILEAILGELEKTLTKGRTAKIMGFGSFSPHLKKERPGRNPKTGEPHIVPARTSVVFRPADHIRKELKKG